jgi:hypothetical protein
VPAQLVGIVYRVFEEKWNPDCGAHSILLFSAASRITISNAAAELSPSERAIFFSNVFAMAVSRKFVCVVARDDDLRGTRVRPFFCLSFMLSEWVPRKRCAGLQHGGLSQV